MTRPRGDNNSKILRLETHLIKNRNEIFLYIEKFYIYKVIIWSNMTTVNIMVSIVSLEIPDVGNSIPVTGFQ